MVRTWFGGRKHKTLSKAKKVTPRLRIKPWLEAMEERIVPSLFGENFDLVAAPSLPVGWSVSTPTGVPTIGWSTTAAGADTGPNVARVTLPTTVCDTYLISPVIRVNSSAAQLSFRNNWNFENGFDGGVLEVSVNGSAFTDILTAGGSFVANGYNGTISTAFSSPISGRSAWTGISGAYLTSTVNLAASMANTNVQFRWRAASDSSVASGNPTWLVDTITLRDNNAENFDFTAAPALPAGWFTTSTVATFWTNTASTADTAPNSMFVADPAIVSDNRLISPLIPITAANRRLTFRNFYNTETFWDGGVLEISINGGAFTDIITAGGSFISNGYNLTLNTSANPIGGRAAWSGSSGGYLTTVVDLPNSALNQNVRLQWREGSDASVSSTGWRIDSISLGGANTAPSFGSISFSPTTVSEGGLVTLSGTVIDNVGDSDTLFINWGDGSPVQTQGGLTNGSAFLISHTYTDDNPTGTAFDLTRIRVMLRDQLNAESGLMGVNDSFEDGTISGWTSVLNGGTSSVVTSYLEQGSGGPTFTAQMGSQFAILTGGAANIYQTLSRTFSANAGDVITGSAFFDSNDNIGDNGYVRIVQGNVTLFSASDTSVGSFGFSPWTSWSFTAPSAGTYTLEAGVQNVLDTLFTPVLGLDVNPRTLNPALQVNNVAPTITGFTLNGTTTTTITEGGTVTLSGTFTDPARLIATETFNGTVNWGDGALSALTINAVAGTFTASHVYADDHPNTGTISDNFNISVTLTDDDLGTTTTTRTAGVTVQNVAPTITGFTLNGGTTATITEGNTVTLSGTFTDPARLVATETFNGTVNWGDGSTSALTINAAAGTFTASHIYVDDHPATGTSSDNFNISITLNDDDLGTTTNTRISGVTVQNTPPTIVGFTLNGGTTTTINEGGTVTLSGTFSDPARLIATETFTGTVNWGNGNTTALTINTSAGTFTATTTYPDDDLPPGSPGVFNVTVTLSDDDLGTTTNTRTSGVIVNNVAPVLVAPGNQTGTEGTNAVFNLGTFSDVGVNDTPWTVNVNWGDTTSNSFTTATQGAISRNHIYVDNGTFNVNVTVTDKDGGVSNSITFQVVVSNANPVLTAPGNQSATEGTSTAFNLGSFTDLGANDNPWTVSVNWGDTSSGSFTVATQGAITRNHTYVDNGTFTVNVSVMDKDGGNSNTISFQVVVNNANPLVTSPSNQSSSEGTNTTFSLGTFSDLGVNDSPWTVNVNWGDTTSGSFTTATQGALSRAHTYADNGTFTVNFTVTDKDGGISNTGSFQVVVGNLAPILTGPSNQSATEGTATPFSLGSFTDAGANDNPWTVNVNWGDTGTDSFTSNTQGGINRNHTYADNGTFTVSVTVTDKDGAVSNTATFQVVVNNAGPILTGPSNQSATEGTSTPFSLGSFTDLGANDNPWTVDVNWGDSGTDSFTTASQGGIGFNHTYADNGTYNVNVTVTDKDGAVSNTASFQVVVGNAAPVLTGPADQSGTEGTAATFNLGSFTDAGVNDNPWTVNVNWGDSGTDSFTTATQGGLSFNHTFTDNGTYSVAVTVTDKDGGVSNTATFQVNVINANPILTGPADQSSSEGSLAAFNLGNFSDLGVNDNPWTVDVAWGDSGTDNFSVAAQGAIGFTHTYADNGTYTVMVTVTDKDGGISNTATFLVNVSNANPILTNPGNQGSTEGASTLFNLGSFTDAGVNDNPWTVDVAWGDSGSDSFTTAAQGGLSFNHAYSDNGTYTVSVFVTDKDGGVSNTITFQVVVNNAVPVLAGPGDQSSNEGASMAFSLGSFTDVGVNDNPWTVAVTWGDTGSDSFTVGTQGAISFNHNYLDNGTYTVNVTVTDKDGGASNTISFQVVVANLDPTATGMNNNGPINEGGSATVSLTGVADPSPVDSGSLHYSFALAPGSLAPDYASAGTVNSGMFPFADNGSYTVYGRVYDKDGGISATFSTTVIVNNVAPTVNSFNITGGLDSDGNGTPGVPINFQVTASDPGALDSFTYDFDWNYNGTTFNVQQTVGPLGPVGRSPLNISHTYAVDGSYQPAVRVTDKDGGISLIFLSPPVDVGVVFIKDGNLIVNGSNGNDNITVDGTNRAAVRVTRNSPTWNYGPFNLSGGGRIIIRARAGIDTVSVSGNVAAEIYGGAGNDFLNGGGGDDVIYGEDGDDTLSPGAGHDVAIGGLGRDMLTGGNGDDILLGGSVNALIWDWTALRNTSTSWSTYTGPAGTGPATLTTLASQTTDNGDFANFDRFWGSTGKDAFLYRSTGTNPDQINDYSLSARDYLLALT